MITDREIMMAIVDNDCLTKSDAAVLLEGDGLNRYRKAVDLYHKNMVSKILFSGNIVDRDYGSYPFEEIEPLLLNSGIPKEDIMYENKSTNTREQAEEVVQIAQEYGWKKLALVASHEHQYRAYLTFLKVVFEKKIDIILYNAPVRNLNWFVDEGWGLRFERLKAEIDRIEKYSELGHLANVNEVVAYQKWKENLLYEV